MSNGTRRHVGESPRSCRGPSGEGLVLMKHQGRAADLPRSWRNGCANSSTFPATGTAAVKDRIEPPPPPGDCRRRRRGLFGLALRKMAFIEVRLIGRTGEEPVECRRITVSDGGAEFVERRPKAQRGGTGGRPISGSTAGGRPPSTAAHASSGLHQVQSAATLWT